MILDTSFLIDLLRNDAGAVSKIKELERKNEQLSIVTITVFELWQGLPKKATALQIQKLFELFESLNVLDFNFETAIEAGEIQRRLIAKGNMIDPEDAMIAGLARLCQEKVLTKNIKHFDKITEIEIETY